MRRREFLSLSGASIGGVLVYSLDRELSRIAPQRTPTLRFPLHFFRRSEALIVAAACSRIFPSDSSGPGAAEAGVAIFIDRQLAGPWGEDRHRYRQEPFVEAAAAEFGYQGRSTPRELYRQGLVDLAGFADLKPQDQDERLRKIQNQPFFALLRQNTIEGMFCDPLHGGNRDMIGWQLVGFPGPRLSNFDDVDRHFGELFRPKPASLGQMGNGPVHSKKDSR